LFDIPRDKTSHVISEQLTYRANYSYFSKVAHSAHSTQHSHWPRKTRKNTLNKTVMETLTIWLRGDANLIQIQVLVYRSEKTTSKVDKAFETQPPDDITLFLNQAEP
ncbi:MAG: hypothetical protein ACOC4C_00710, partial [Fibrobacterota bacterium]